MSVLAGRAALVTGASRGVGAAIAGVLADEGAVVVNYLRVGEMGTARISRRGRRSLKGRTQGRIFRA